MIQFIVVVLCVAAVVGYFYFGGYAQKIKGFKEEAVLLVRDSTPETFCETLTSVVYDNKGQVISTLKGEKDVYYLSYKELPFYATSAIISIEDKKFFEHKGVDYKAIVRAAMAALEKGEVTQGASTITQQLARDTFLTQDRKWERKVEEIFVALELEKKYSKEQILEYYLNNIYFANGYYGLQAASKGYFNKNASELSLSQTCFLLAIPNGPNKYNPLEHMDNTIARRNLILDNMLGDQVISQNAYDEAINEIIELEMVKSEKKDYIETFAYYCATRALMERDGFVFKTSFSSEEKKREYEQAYQESYNRWNEALFTSGYRIYTSLDLDMQQQLQEAIDNELSKFEEIGEDGIYEMQGAATCIDNDTGMVKAIVGGRSQNLKGYTLNRAYQSFRQPGSSIKPLIVYPPAFERGYKPDTKVLDMPIQDGPKNAGGTYSGEITLLTAVSSSKNTIAWQLFEELTPEVGLSYIKNMGFSKIVDDDYVLPASLGGLTNGVSTLEMAKGFATLENDGFCRDAGCIEKIVLNNGAVLYEANQEGVQIYRENAARTMTNMLQYVIYEGTAKSISLGEMPCAAKTGTTNDLKDGWFVGYTPYYTTSVWVGYDLPRTVEGLGGGTYPGKIWETFMNQIHEGLEPIDFLPPVTYYGPEEVQEMTEDEVVDSEDEFEIENFETVTLTFEGVGVPEGAIPDNAIDVVVTTNGL